MADFAQWVVAAEEKMPWGKGQFMKFYNKNRDEAALYLIENDIVANALKALLKKEKEWKGTATELLSDFNEYIDDQTKNNKSWPRQANYLSKRLNRIAQSLRSSGININSTKIKGRKIWNFTLIDSQGVDSQDYSKLLN